MNEAQVGFGFVEGPPASGVVSLIHAARRGDCSAIALLLESGVDVNEAVPIGPWKENYTALMVAAGSADGAGVETVRLLLARGADARFLTDGDSALTAALGGLWWSDGEGGDIDRARALFEAGSPLPNGPDARGYLLSKAARTGDLDRVEFLLELGFSPEAYWNEDEERESRLQLVESMLKQQGLPLDSTSSEADQVRRTFGEISEGPSPERIPIFQAVESGNWQLVQRLVAAGASLGRQDFLRRTAMYHARTPSMACQLRDAGLSLEHRGKFEESPISHAIRCGDIEILKSLIVAGANVHATCDHGYTLLMEAVGSVRMREVVCVLMDAGIDPHAVSEFGYNAFHAGVDQDYSPKSLENCREKFGILTELGIDIEHRKNDGMTPLAFAVHRGSQGEVQALCELGANPNAVCDVFACEHGRCTRVKRPILFASESAERLESLLRAGADPLAVDEQGCTAAERSLLGLVRKVGCEDDACQQVRAELERRLASLPVNKPHRQDEFIAAAFRLFIDSLTEFVRDDPQPDTTERQFEFLSFLSKRTALLLAYEMWARLRNGSNGM